MQPIRAVWRIWPTLLFALALQTTWFARLTLWDTHIDLPLLTVVSVGLLLGSETGAIFGFAAGLACGYCAAFNVGSFAVSRAAVGAVCGQFDTLMSRDNPLAPPLCAAGSTVLANLVFAIMSPTSFSVMWWLQHTIAAVAAHTVLILPVHWAMARILAPRSRYRYGSLR